MSWIPTADCISAVSVISASGDSSDGKLSPFKSSGSAVEFWCLIEGLLRGWLIVSRWATGLVGGDRDWGNGRGVVGELGCDVKSAEAKEVIEPRRSMSRAGRVKPPPGSITGTIDARDCIGSLERDADILRPSEARRPCCCRFGIAVSRSALVWTWSEVDECKSAVGRFKAVDGPA